MTNSGAQNSGLGSEVPNYENANRTRDKFTGLDKLKLNTLTATNILGGEVGNELLQPPKLKKILKLGLVIDLGKNSKDFLNKAADMNVHSFDRFVTNFSANFNVSKEAINADPEFQKAFTDWQDMGLNRAKRLKEKKKFVFLQDKFQLKLAGFSSEKNENVSAFCSSYLNNEKRRNLMVKIVSKLDADDADPKSKLLVEKWRAEKISLNQKLEKGEITEAQYLKESDKVDEKTIKSSGNKELQQEYKDYQDDISDGVDSKETKSVILPLDSADQLVKNTDQVKQALVSVNSDAFHMNLHDDGTASVVVGPEGYPMEVAVYKNDKTKQFVYYIADKFADEGIVRVDSSKIADALDDRYLDAYLSDKLSLGTDDSDSPNKVPDKDMILLAERLLGNGNVRGYRVEGRNREVMNGLVDLLKVPSKKYLNYYKKVEALNLFFRKDDNVDSVRRKILAGEKPTLDGILGDK